MPSTILAPSPRQAVAERLLGTRSTVADLEALWAQPPRASGDDLAVIIPAFPAPRSLGQDREWEAVTAEHGPRWYGRLKTRNGGTSTHALAGTREGRSYVFTATLGTVTVGCHDQVRRERALQANADRRRRDSDLHAALAAATSVEHATMVANTVHGRSITAWTAKSRQRMVRVFASIDYTPMDVILGDGALVTLTYPGDWLAVAPTGRAVKEHFQELCRRWQRATGTAWVGLWKLEFQDRGAPHIHLYCKVPVRVRGLPFTLWLSQTWAKIVNASQATGEYQRHLSAGTNVDFGKASHFTDPKRLAVYFLKHSTKTSDGKEYQHQVPEQWHGDGDGPGSFWGYRGLAKPTVIMELDFRDFCTARRVLRRMRAGNARQVAYQRARHAALLDGATPAAATRRATAERPPKEWTLGTSGALTGGWVLVNDGIAAALDVGRYLTARRAA